jgi:hypothetical protein
MRGYKTTLNRKYNFLAAGCQLSTFLPAHLRAVTAGMPGNPTGFPTGFRNHIEFFSPTRNGVSLASYQMQITPSWKIRPDVVQIPVDFVQRVWHESLSFGNSQGCPIVCLPSNFPYSY